VNCTRVQALLPLYAGADLPAHEAERVCAHLETCAPCRDLAEEFAASTAWLQAAPPPEFDEALFAALRADVQQGIAQAESKPSWSERWLSLVNWRWAWVPVLALILLAIALNWQRQRALPTLQPEKVMVKNRSSQTPTPTLPGQETPIRELNRLAVRDGRGRKQMRKGASLGNNVVPQEIAVKLDIAAPSGESVLATTQEVTRIEIQTADPNIRIIWLTPKPQDATNPAETPNR
jgi:anti-sigma factor RsiW